MNTKFNQGAFSLINQKPISKCGGFCESVNEGECLNVCHSVPVDKDERRKFAKRLQEKFRASSLEADSELSNTNSLK